MNYLLDTCVLSELRRPAPDTGLIEWLEDGSESALAIPVTVLGEIQQGISQLAESGKRNTLQLWLDQELTPRFAGRVLDIDSATMRTWGILRGEGKRKGQNHPVVDCLIAATAIRHNLTLVTRNTDDFERLPVLLLNPWTGEPTGRDR